MLTRASGLTTPTPNASHKGKGSCQNLRASPSASRPFPAREGFDLPAAPLRGFRARAGRAAPRAAEAAGQAPGGCRAGIAVAQRDPNSAVRRDPPGDVDREVAAVGEHAVSDAHGITVAGDAVAPRGEDRHAPDAIVARRTAKLVFAASAAEAAISAAAPSRTWFRKDVT